MIVPTKSGRALIWDETFDNFFQIQSSFQWTADSLENQIVSVLPTRDILLDGNLIGALGSNADLNIVSYPLFTSPFVDSFFFSP